MAGVLFAARHEQRWVSKSSLLPDEPNDLTNPVSNGDDDDDDDAHRGCLRESSHDDWVVCSFEDSHIHVWTGCVEILHRFRGGQAIIPWRRLYSGRISVLRQNCEVPLTEALITSAHPPSCLDTSFFSFSFFPRTFSLSRLGTRTHCFKA